MDTRLAVGIKQRINDRAKLMENGARQKAKPQLFKLGVLTSYTVTNETSLSIYSENRKKKKMNRWYPARNIVLLKAA